MKIVVSRYNENIEWTYQLPNVVLYNKGHPLENSIVLPNVGREGHTFYTYIYDNYDNLDDYTIFLQGNPFDHSPNIIKTITNYINANKENNLNIDFQFISERILLSNLTNCNISYGIPMVEVYEKLFNEKKTHLPFIFGAGAQFIVSKKCILSRPKEFYLKVINLLDKSINPIEGFVIERFHKIIFTNQAL